MVEKALTTVPKQVTLFDRHGDPAIYLDDGRCANGPGSDCLNIIDHRTGERRKPVLQDVVEAATVCDALSHIDFVMSMFLPVDVDMMVSDRYQMEVLLNTTTKPIVFVTNEFSGCVDAVEMAESVAGGAEALMLRPRVACYINVTTGLRHNEEALQKLLFLAGKGLPFMYVPVVIAGISGPMTVAASTALINVGMLVGVVLSQLKREGAPFIAPGWGGGLDMRTMVSPYCSPNPRGVAHAMARFYRLPMFGLGGCSESKLVDQQAAAEASLTLMVENIFPHLGAPSILMDFTDLDRLEDVMRREKPGVVYIEVISNPMIKVIDAPAVIDMAHRYGARVIVDNTFTTPYLLKPMEMGADLISHSVTKFLSGHGDVLAGSVSCHRRDFDKLHDMLIQVGCTLGPNEAWLALRGLKTFSLRMERQCANALAVAQYLEGHPLIERVRYPGLTSHAQHETAKRILDGRYGAMLSFDIAHCDQRKAFRFLDALQIILPATTLGDIYSLIANPARTTHHWLSEEELAAIGIRAGTFRMSVGIEHIEDLKEDLDQALKASV